MLRLEPYSVGDLQKFLGFLRDCENLGAFDTSSICNELTAKISESVAARDRAVEARNVASEVQSRDEHREALKIFDACPQCGRTRLRRTVVEKDAIITCLGCRWSMYVGEV